MLRPIGLTGEKKMLESTRGVNTHKGAIFSLGILCAVAGKLKSDEHNADTICEYIKCIASGLTDELGVIKSEKELTDGERIYKQHGILGIRGEVEAGFPSVRKYGLPTLKNMIHEGQFDRNEIMIQVLIQIMCHVDDSNVLARKGLEGLDFVRKESEKALQLGGVYNKEGWYYIVNMDRVFADQNISPGGTADLLAVTLMLHFLEHQGRLY